MDSIIEFAKSLTREINRVGAEVREKEELDDLNNETDVLRCGGWQHVSFPRNRPYEYRSNYCTGVLTVQTSENATFCSFLSAAGLGTGKWMYEVTLHSDGLMQIGWTIPELDWTPSYGVGDGVGSYAYDGYRVKAWCVTSTDYGMRWRRGDVISVCVDLDNARMRYYQNGVDLGVAFSDFPTVRGCPYFRDANMLHPAISMSHGQSCSVNFGVVDFKFPVMGYRPVHAANHIALAEVRVAAKALLETSKEVAAKVDSNDTKGRAVAEMKLQIAADLTLSHMSFDGATARVVFDTLQEAASSSEFIFEAIYGLSPKDCMMLMTELLAQFSLRARDTPLRQDPYISLVLSIMRRAAKMSSESGALGNRQASEPIMGCIFDLFNGYDSAAVPAVDDAEAIAAALRETWPLLESNTEVRANILDVLMQSSATVRVLYDVDQALTMPESRHLLLLALTRLWMSWEYKFTDLMPEWSLTLDTPDAIVQLRLGGGQPFLLAEYPGVHRARPSNDKLPPKQRFSIDTFTSLIDHTTMMRAPMDLERSLEYGQRMAQLYAPQMFPSVAWICGVIADAVVAYSHGDLFRFLPSSWLVFLVDNLLILKRLWAGFAEFVRRNHNTSSALRITLCDTRIVVPDMTESRELAGFVLFEKRFNYVPLVETLSARDLEEIVCSIVHAFTEKQICLTSVALMLENVTTLDPVTMAIPHANVLQILHEVDIKRGDTPNTEDRRLSDAWRHAIEKRKLTMDEMHAFAVKLLNLGNEAISAMSARRTLDGPKNDDVMCVMQTSVILRIAAGMCALCPEIFLSSGYDDLMSRFDDVLQGAILQTYLEKRSEKSFVYSALYALLAIIAEGPMRDVVANELVRSMDCENDHMDLVVGTSLDDPLHPLHRDRSTALVEFVEKIKTMREQKSEMNKESESSSGNEECAICCRRSADTRLMPCEHTSCRVCIDRHRSENKFCFYCKREVEWLEPVTVVAKKRE